jgi:hypothetical protein
MSSYPKSWFTSAAAYLRVAIARTT